MMASIAKQREVSSKCQKSHNARELDISAHVNIALCKFMIAQCKDNTLHAGQKQQKS